jgi:hypothetical protein
MARKIVNQPHRTPNPEKPHSAAKGAAGRRGPADPAVPPSSARDEAESEEPNFDSCFDEMNVILSQSIEQPDPDPNLESPASDYPVPAELAAAGHPKPKQPRTSEIFRSVAPLVIGAGPEAPASVVREPQAATGPEPGEKLSGAATVADLVVMDRDRHVQDSAVEEDDALAEPRISWSLVLLLSYSSAITLALIWILWTGRTSRIAEPRSAASPALVVPPRTAVRDRAVQAPMIPPENLVTLGQTARLGDLKVTPLAVLAIHLELVRPIDPPEYRREEEESLVLRLRLTNVSKTRAFVPLDPYLLRERGLRPFEPFIAVTDGPNIPLYPLAIDSEWSIAGQEFPKLDPGDTAETIVAAEPGSAHRAAGAMTWRVRLRTGVYRTDLLGVRFHPNQVRHVLTLDEAASEGSP